MALDADNPVLKLLLESDLNAGLEHFKSLQNPTPEDQFWCGQIYVLQGQTLPALEQFGFAYRDGLEDAMVLLAGLQKENGDYSRVRTTLASVDVAKLEPVGRATFEMERSRLSCADGQLRSAAEHAEAAVYIALTDPVAVNFIGNYAAVAADLFSRSGHSAKVEELIAYALPRASSRQHPWLILTRAVAQMYEGQFDAAQKDLESLEAQNNSTSPESATIEAAAPSLKSTVAYYSGQLNRMQGLNEAAANHFLEATQIARDHGHKEIECYAHLGLVWLAASTDNLPFARAHLARAHALADGLTLHAELALASGALMAKNGDMQSIDMIEKAITAFELAENDRDRGLAHLHMAEALLRFDRVQEAQTHLERCVDARHALGSGAVFAAELRTLPNVFQHLSIQSAQASGKTNKYAATLLEDWRALEHYAPSQITLVTLGGYQLLIDGKAVRLEAGVPRTCELISFMLEFGPARLDDLQTGVFPEELGQLSRDYIHQIRKAVKKAIPSLHLHFEKTTRIYTVQPQGVRLNWDVRGVREAVAMGGENGLRRALALFTGSFMPRSEQEWVYDLRLELEHNIAQLGLSVLQDLEKLEEHDRIIELALRLIEVSPVQIEIGLLLIRAMLAGRGQAAAKETHAMLCQRFLAKIGEVPAEFSAPRGLENLLN
jgi:tetratricopeptide (TPR) repeat protein